MLFDKFDEYFQKLLIAQYDISEIIDHKLTRGQMREDFLKRVITDQFPNLSITSGVITDSRTQSPQTDIIITKHSCRSRRLGGFNVVDIADVEMVLEIKSNGTGTDLKKSNDDFGKIKALSTDKIPLCGMFCYRIDLEVNTLMKRFGYKWDSQNQTFEEYDDSFVQYRNMDFLICIQSDEEYPEEDREIFIIWNPGGTNWRGDSEPKYSYLRDKPSLKNLFGILNDLNR